MNRSRVFTLLILAISCNSPETINQPNVTGSIGSSAMISSAHPLATKVGLEVMRNGGNAVDAAIAVHYALAVVYPQAGNIGGGGFAVYRLANGEYGSLDFREKAPSKASRDMYLDEQGEIINDLSTIGHLASGVPGSVDGMVHLHEKLGTQPLAELIQPAIELAYYGHVLTDKIANVLNDKRDDFAKVNGTDFFLINEDGWKAGDTIRYQELASTLTQIRDRGRAGFYDGIVADQIVKEMQRGRGFISKEDLAAYESVWRDPVIGSYRGHKIISVSPPSSGGVAIIQLLQGAEAYDIEALGHNTSEGIHLMTELERRVYADRATHLGDPDFHDVPVDMLLDPTYNASRFSTLQMDEKTNSEEIDAGNVAIVESEETTHFSVVDPQGNAVAITTTLNSSFGSKVYVRGAGFFLNNEMDDFSSKPGTPNQFGLIGGDANAIESEKRMLSSMTPTIIVKDNQLKMVLGTPGGSTIITSVFQVIMNVVDHKMTMQQAVNANRVHSQWLPDQISIEKDGLDESVIRSLERMGHTVKERSSIGRMDCILVREDGTLEGGADYTRGDNYAEGF